jgi:hypothetical protein
MTENENQNNYLDNTELPEEEVITNYFINERTLTKLGKAIRKITNTSNKLYTEEMIESLDTVGIFSQYNEGEVILDITPATVSYVDGNVIIK